MGMILWIWNNKDGIIASIFAAIICWGVKKLLELIRVRKSIYSGEWEQLIYENNDYIEVILKDILVSF